MRQLAGIVFLSLMLVSRAGAEPLHVVSSIKPVHLLVTAVGGDAVRSELLLEPGFSPHDARLKPSQWRAVRAAELIVWVGPSMEAFLAGVLSRLSTKVTLSEAVPAAAVAADPHIWLAVDHVAAMVEFLEDALAEQRPDQAETFRRNGERLMTQLRRRHAQLRGALAGKTPRYLLPHGGYRHFEHQYGLSPSGVLSPDGEELPGTAHVFALSEQLLAGEFDCVFNEPQHESVLLKRLLEGVPVPTIALDPMGADVPVNADGFVEYYGAIGDAFLQCLKKSKAAGEA